MYVPSSRFSDHQHVTQHIYCDFQFRKKRSRPAIAGKPRCSVYKLWQKYKCEKRAYNIALFYGVDVDK